MERKCASVPLAAVAVVLGLAVPLAAQSTKDAYPFATQQAVEQAQGREARFQAIEHDRVGFVMALLDPWRSHFADGGEEMESYLLRAPVERLDAASAARDFDSFRAAATGRPKTNVLGVAPTDLVFFPVPPCRIFDTRSGVGGILVAGVVQNFRVNGDMSSQGGDAGGCGIPTDPNAVVFNLAAVTPAGAGNIRAWAFGDPVPGAAAMNFNPTNTSPALSNMITVPTCDICGFDISVRADVSNVHAVGDIVGYYDVPSGLTTNRISTFNGVAVPSANTTLTSITFTPQKSGTVITTLTGWCNIGATNTNVIWGFGETASPFEDNAVEENNGTGSGQSALAVVDRLTVTGGASTTVTATARREFGAGSVACTGQLIVAETP